MDSGVQAAACETESICPAPKNKRYPLGYLLFFTGAGIEEGGLISRSQSSILQLDKLECNKGGHCMLNIGSLILGACAWLFAGLAISTPKAFTSHKNTLVSFSLCIISLSMQLFEMNRRVLLGDYAAIEDTIRAVLIASVALVSVTVILNLIALVKAKSK